MNKTKLSENNIKELKDLFKLPKREMSYVAKLNSYLEKTTYKSFYSLEKALKNTGIISDFEITPTQGKPVKLYATQDKNKYTPYEIAQALYPRGYFCNFTSIYYHGLTNQIPVKIYIAIEGIREKDHIENISNITLTDFNIKTAFLKPHRTSEKKFKFQKYEIQLNEKVSRNRTGIELLKHNIIGTDFEITCLERALIDAVVSPQYNGGIANVIEYYQTASHKIDVKKFLKIYTDLHFIYPYWQTIGFISEKKGLTKLAEKLYTNFKIKNKFFLDHMAKTSWNFDEKWQIYYPESLF